MAFGLLSPILAMLLILGLSLPAFAQTKPQVDLSGKNVLVLHAVCHTIVEAHRGRIWAEDNPDAGTTFFIELAIYQSGK
jgi:light-regulated signal transduction histidine kinase (bacteriophytochrome)